MACLPACLLAGSRQQQQQQQALERLCPGAVWWLPFAVCSLRPWCRLGLAAGACTPLAARKAHVRCWPQPCPPQASDRNVLFGQKGRCANAVPQSHDEQLSLLRQAFQIADRKERQQVR